MREGEIRSMHMATARRSALLFGQFEILNNRIKAYETVLSSRKNILKAIWSPAWLKRMVDAENLRLIEEGKRKMEEIAERPRLAVAK